MARRRAETRVPRQKKERSAPAWLGTLRWEMARARTPRTAGMICLSSNLAGLPEPDRLADRPQAPGLCTLEQTPLIRGTNGIRRPDRSPRTGKERSPNGMGSARVLETAASGAGVPLPLRFFLHAVSRAGPISGMPAGRGCQSPRCRGCAHGLPWRGRRTGRCCGTRTDQTGRT